MGWGGGGFFCINSGRNVNHAENPNYEINPNVSSTTAFSFVKHMFWQNIFSSVRRENWPEPGSYSKANILFIIILVIL